MNALQFITILVGLLIAGEASALAVSIHIIQKSNNAWVSLKNDLFLAFDVVVGLALVFLAFYGENFPQPTWLPLFVLLSIVTHIYRIWEYLTGIASSFCGNRSLFFLNIIKLTGLLLLPVWGVMI